jgi:hypothetical protein
MQSIDLIRDNLAQSRARVLARIDDVRWEAVFDGDDVSGDVAVFPPFDEVLATCQNVRASTLALVGTFSEHHLDLPSAHVPPGYEDTFGTYRQCLQYVADDWYMHRGHLADARRAAGIARMWV